MSLTYSMVIVEKIIKDDETSKLLSLIYLPRIQRVKLNPYKEIRILFRYFVPYKMVHIFVVYNSASLCVNHLIKYHLKLIVLGITTIIPTVVLITTQ